jgi:hypothetical protein
MGEGVFHISRDSGPLRGNSIVYIKHRKSSLKLECNSLNLNTEPKSMMMMIMGLVTATSL